MIIGVTGKSGSGKSTLAKHLAKEIGFIYVDIDSIGHKALMQPEIIDAIKEQYGNEVLDKNGKVDRKKVGEIVFSNREEMSTLAACAWEYMKNSINKILEDNKNVVLDWVLLPETHYWDSCNYTILMTSDNETRIKRVMERDNITREYCLKRDDSSPNYVGIGVYSVVQNNYTVDYMKHAINTISTYIRQNYNI